jgi:hypothetical protein
VLIALYSIHSERQCCERLEYDLLCTWFLDLNIADPAFNPTTFSKNRERLLGHDAVRKFFVAVRDEAKRRRLLSVDHVTVDGTLLEAWALLKRFTPKEQPDRPEGDPPGGTVTGAATQRWTFTATSGATRCISPRPIPRRGWRRRARAKRRRCA